MPDAASAAQPELAPGSTFGPYRIDRMLGRGGMGAVYEAVHVSEGRVVALKLLNLGLTDETVRQRFLREGLTAAAINHPNTVYVYGTEEIDGTLAITMELVPGGTLEDKVKARGQLPWSEVVGDMLQVIDGLSAAFDAGVLHRDVKPANCFIGATGEVKVGDFGLSKPVEGAELQRLTQTGVFMGTPVFSSPEQLLGETLDARSDIYAVGVTFYYLLTGELPYASGSMMQVVAAVLNGEPAPLTKYRSDIPPAVAAVVMKAMARKVGDRYQTYAEFRNAVAGLRATELEPATLGNRFRAAIIDAFTTGIVSAGVSALTVGPTPLGAPSSKIWFSAALGFATTLVVVGIPEGLRGASVGKWIVQLRVIGPDGGAPGVWRAAARVALFSLTDLLVTLLRTRNTSAQSASLLSLVVSVSGLLAFTLTARRRNGWRMVHDFATSTRVVRHREAGSAVRQVDTQSGAAPQLSGNEPRRGSYVVLGAVGEGSQVLRGWDPVVRRAVWIVPHAPGAPEVPAARRAVARLTRLRWVGGRRSDSEVWDAFEAPVGEPLLVRATQPVSWESLRNWLSDLLSELSAGDADGTAVPRYDIGALFITPKDRLVVVEGADRDADGGGSWKSLVAALLDAVAHGVDAAPAPFPHHATIAIQRIRAADTPAHALEALEATRVRRSSVTPRRRVALVAATVAPALFMTGIGALSSRQATRLDPQGQLLGELSSFASAPAVVRRPDTVRTARTPTRGRNLPAALHRLGLMPSLDADTSTPRDTVARQRELVEAYIITEMRQPVAAVVAGGPQPRAAGNVKTLRTLLTRLGLDSGRTPRSVDSATAREARALVDSVWRRKVPGSESDAFTAATAWLSLVGVLIIGAVVSTLACLVGRRGPLLRLFQVEIVRRDGRLAGRGRMLWRTLFVWSPAWLLVLVIWSANRVSEGVLAAALAVIGVASVAAFVIHIWRCARRPQRGLVELATGTWVVPE